MITPRRFIESLRREPGATVAIGTVVQADPLAVMFDGEPGADDVEWPRLGGYPPGVGDRVFMQRAGKTWVVAGRLGVGLTGARMPPGTVVAKVQRQAAVSLANNTDVAIPWDTQLYVPIASVHSLVSNQARLYPPWPGLWRLDATAGFDGGDSNGRRRGHFQKNAADIAGSRHAGQAVNGGSQAVSFPVSVTETANGVDDYFQLVQSQNRGSALNTATDPPSYPTMTLTYAGPDLTDEEDPADEEEDA